MNAVAFAARKLPDALLLVAAREIEPPDIRPRIYFTLAELYEISPSAISSQIVLFGFRMSRDWST